MEPVEVAVESVDEVIEYNVGLMELTIVEGEPSGAPVVAVVFPGVVR